MAITKLLEQDGVPHERQPIMKSSSNRSPLSFDETSLFDQASVARFTSSVKQRLNLELRPCQVIAAKYLCGHSIAEMPTGEGKTLATTLAAVLHALSGRKVLIATANDYLAKRDAQWMSELFGDLQLTVGCITSLSSADERTVAYNAHVTYGTLREFAFDYLKQSLANRQSESLVNRTAYKFDALIIDEADSVLIDEARTPLIITAATGSISPSAEACYRWSASLVREFIAEVDFVYLQELDAMALTPSGRRRILQAKMPDAMGPLSTTEIQHAVERALWVNAKIQRDVHYVVEEGQLNLVDEYTGRKSAQRSFGGGIHQAIQACEGLALTPESQPAAKITVQDFVGKFKHLAGITATAWEDRRELASVYGLTVHRVSPHVASQRVDRPPVVACSVQDKYGRIAAETLCHIKNARSVLVATRTIEQSERLSEYFQRSGIDHDVLSARNAELEAAVVAGAGQLHPTSNLGRVTSATNMAGRGTDIRLDARVLEAGGLHVIVSEPHAASRIDRQLYGRCGRQGDPGSTQLYCSPEDEILEQAFGVDRALRIRQAAASGASDGWLMSQLTRAQRHVARRHRIDRARLTAHEAAMTESLLSLGLDPHLDPLPTNF